MKKQLLTGAFLVAAFFSAKAQDSCDDAFVITANGTYTVDAIDGEYVGSCIGTAATAAEWYVITPLQNSLIRVNTNLDVNVENEADTRFSIITGDCENLTCYDAMDDISASNYLGDLTFQAIAGETYYISFDDRWLDTGFDFQITITPTTCFYPTGFTLGENGITQTTANIAWEEPATAPSGYELEYGLAGFEPGSGIETLELSSPDVEIESLTSGTDYAFYIRTDCGSGDYSEWTGPITFTTGFDAANLNYSYAFETSNLNGWTVETTSGSPWGVESAATLEDFEAQEGENAVGAGAYSAASDSWLFSRGINVANGQVVNISYYASKFIGAGAGGTNNIGVTIGTQPISDEQTTVLTAQTAITSQDWTQKTATFTAPAAGVYYIGFHYTSPAQTATNYGWAFIDNVVVTSPTAGSEDFSADTFAVYPNPANNVVNVSATNDIINNVTLADVNGRTVKTVNVASNNGQINVSDLANGVYMMTISSDKGSVTKKFVKN